MNLYEAISKNVFDSRGESFTEFSIKLDNGKEVYLNVATDSIKNNVPYEDTEVYIYNKPFAEITEEPTEDDYYNCSEEEAKELYNKCLENK